MPLSRRTRLAAAPLAALALAGCSTPDDALFFALAGETPGARTPYVDVNGATRLLRGPPIPAWRSYRPAVAPEGKAVGATEEVRRAYEAVRQRISDRDDEFSVRFRSMALYGKQYVQAVAELRMQPGDPLPPYDARFRQRLADARSALNTLEGDMIKTTATLRRLERDYVAAQAVAGRARSLAVDTPEPGTDRAVRPALISASQATVSTAGQMAAAARGTLGRLVVYISQQRETLGRLEADVRAAKGPSRLDQIRTAETIVDILPESWQPEAYRREKRREEEEKKNKAK